MRFRRALLSSAVPLLLAQPAAAQAGRPTVSVAGTVVDESGMPIQGVAVSPLGAGFIARSAERGQFQLPALTSGTYRVVARRTGFVPDTVQVELAPDDSVSLWIVLRRIVVQLRSVVVDADYAAPRLAAFEERRHRSFGGHFVTRPDIEAQAPSETSDLLRRVPGLRVADSSHVMVPISNRGYKVLRIGQELVAAQCVMRIGLNGFIRNSSFTLDSVSPQDIYGIEIYSGPATIPPQFNAGAIDMSCGLVMIWTKSA